MLDSLVRVSRRVGWETDRFATDPRAGGEGPRSRSGRSPPALRAVPTSRTATPSPDVATQAGRVLGRAAGQHLGRLKHPLRRGGYLPPGLLTATQPVVALSPRKVHSGARPGARGPAGDGSEPRAQNARQR
jgi:hypothetical protein